MIRAKTLFQQVLLLLGDATVFFVSLCLTLLIRYQTIDSHTFIVHFWPFLPLFLMWLACFYVVGLSNLHLARQPLKMLRAYLEGMIANLGISLACFYLTPGLGIEPRTNLLIDFTVTLLLGYAFRLVFSRILVSVVQPERILFFGSVSEAERIKQLVKASTYHAVLAVIMTKPEELTVKHDPAVYVSADLENLGRIIKEQNISTLVIDSSNAAPELTSRLYPTLFWPVELLDRVELEELTTGRIPLEYVSETWFLRHLRESDKIFYEFLKRGFDLLISIPIGLITLATIPFVAIGTKLSSPGPLFIHQKRVGKNGKLFTLIKFRSMHVQSANGLSEPNGPQFTTNAKTDPRLFTFGRWMRRLRIDELPQVWNMIRGDISFIGPRPERPEFVEPLLERMPYYALRHLTKPGLTGWAQVTWLKPNSTIDDNLTKLQYDLYYIKHRSFFLDLSILLKTVGIVLKRQGT